MSSMLAEDGLLLTECQGERGHFVKYRMRTIVTSLNHYMLNTINAKRYGHYQAVQIQ